jgi:hypothetical protein
VFEAEARTRRRQEEPEVVRQVHEYEVARWEERICRVKLEIVDLNSE